MSEAREESPCAECPGLCCSFRRGRVSLIGLDAGERYDSAMLEYEYINDLLLADGTPVEMEWYVVEHEEGDDRRRYIAFDCQHLTDDGRCGVYGDRPELCRAYECEAFDEDVDVQEFISKMERPDGELADATVRDVTARVTEIIKRRASDTDE